MTAAIQMPSATDCPHRGRRRGGHGGARRRQKWLGSPSAHDGLERNGQATGNPTRTRSVACRHNARGERVYKDAGGKISRYAFDESGRLLVDDAGAAGGVVQEILWLDDLPVGLLIGKALYLIQPDHLGSPRKITNNKLGAPTLLWDWPILDNPFGERQPNEDPNLNGNTFPFPLRFPGQQYDVETGLHYNYFRDYEPAVNNLDTQD